MKVFLGFIATCLIFTAVSMFIAFVSAAKLSEQAERLLEVISKISALALVRGAARFNTSLRGPSGCSGPRLIDHCPLF
jgi:hypothetical protein